MILEYTQSDIAEHWVGNMPIKKQTNWCVYCGIKLKQTQQRVRQHDDETRDHVFPRSEGFSITSPACRACNEKKDITRLAEWLKSAWLAERRNEIQFQYETIPPWDAMKWRIYIETTLSDSSQIREEVLRGLK